MDQHEMVAKLKELCRTLGRTPTRAEFTRVVPAYQLEKAFGTYAALQKAAGLETYRERKPTIEQAKVLLFDIETSPMLVYVFSIWEQNVGLNQIVEDWSVLSWAAKWLGDPEEKIMYQDTRNAKNIRDDSELLKDMWRLLDDADVVVTQNGKSFDSKKLNARFIINGFKPPSSYKHEDVKIMSSRHFGFTSNKLEYITDKLCTKYKKLKHGDFPGFSLWSECLAGNKAAWVEMEKYNKHDVLSLEEAYQKIRPWAGGGVNFNLFHDEEKFVCKCGSESFTRHDKCAYTGSGKYQRFICNDCGAETRGKKNLFSKEKRESLRAKV